MSYSYPKVVGILVKYLLQLVEKRDFPEKGGRLSDKSGYWELSSRISGEIDREIETGSEWWIIHGNCGWLPVGILQRDQNPVTSEWSIVAGKPVALLTSRGWTYVTWCLGHRYNSMVGGDAFSHLQFGMVRSVWRRDKILVHSFFGRIIPGFIALAREALL